MRQDDEIEIAREQAKAEAKEAAKQADAEAREARKAARAAKQAKAAKEKADFERRVSEKRASSGSIWMSTSPRMTKEPAVKATTKAKLNGRRSVDFVDQVEC